MSDFLFLIVSGMILLMFVAPFGFAGFLYNNTPIAFLIVSIFLIWGIPIGVWIIYGLHQTIKDEADKLKKDCDQIGRYLIETQISPKDVTSEGKAYNAIELLKNFPRPDTKPPYRLGSMPLAKYWEKLHYGIEHNSFAREYDSKAKEDYKKRYFLRDINFSTKNLEGISAKKVVFNSCNFNNARISGNMFGARFSNTSFKEAKINVDFSMASLNYVDFSNAKFMYISSFNGAYLGWVNFTGILLNYEDIEQRIKWSKEEARRKGRDFNEPIAYEEAIKEKLQQLREVMKSNGLEYLSKRLYFLKADIRYTNFTNSYLIRANFHEAYGESPCFSQSIIMGSLFTKTDFGQPSFQNTNIERCSFGQAVLSKADFSNVFCVSTFFTNYIPNHTDNQKAIRRMDKPIPRWERFKDFITFTRSQRRGWKEFAEAFAEKRTQFINFFTLKIHKTIITYANFNDSVFERCRFKYVNLEGSTFHNAKMQECSFWFCNFRGCDLTNAKFIDCKGLSVRQLSKAKTLKDAQLPDKLRLPLQKRFPHLFV